MAFKFKGRTIKNKVAEPDLIKPVEKPVIEPKKVIKKEVINTKDEHHSLDDIIVVKRSPFTDDMLTTNNE